MAVERDDPTPPATTFEAHVLGEPRRARILEELGNATDGLDVRTLARRCGLHPNTVRWHLGALSDAGLIRSRRVHSGRPGRPRLVFELAVDASEPSPAFRLLAEMLASALHEQRDGTERARRAGAVWGRQLVTPPSVPGDADGAVTAIVTLLAEHGFEPQDVGAAIEMHRCPFRELVDGYGGVICGLHEGLLAGALDELGADVSLAALSPWARAGVCVAALRGRVSPGAG